MCKVKCGSVKTLQVNPWVRHPKNPHFFEKLNQQDELTPDNADDGLHEVVASERGKPSWTQVATRYQLVGDAKNICVSGIGVKKHWQTCLIYAGVTHKQIRNKM